MVRIIGLAGVVLFLSHAFVTLALRAIEWPAWLEAILESAATFAIFFPIIHLTLIRPLRLQVQERRRSEAALQRSEERYRLLFDHNPHPMWFYDRATLQFLDVNDAAVANYGYSREEFLRMTIKDIRPPEQANKLLERIAKLEPGINRSGYWQHQRKDGSILDVKIISSSLRLDNRCAQLVLALNVTENRKTEQQLREQARLLDLAHDAIIVRDLEGKIQFWNQGAQRLYGWTCQEALGQNVRDLLYKTESEFDPINEALLKSDEWSGELRLLTKERKEVIVNSRLTLVRDSFGIPKAVFGIVFDVTDKKKLEAQFLRAQRLESLGTLAGGIAHDLNNVLAPILMSSEILRDLVTDDAARKLVDLIAQSAQRGAGVVRQVLTFARGAHGERAELQLKHLLRELALIARETFPKSITVQVEIPKELWTVQGDATQLHQVLLNLSVNARDAMPDGGLLKLTAQNILLDENEAAVIPGLRPGPHLLLQVIDTGHGIPAEIIDKIFDPFFTTKPLDKGTGLALSTALGIVKSHGGCICVYSQPNHGTQFKIYLPALANSITPQAREEHHNLAKSHGEMVLIVDDERPVRELTRLALERRGYEVLLAPDGAEALARQREHPHQIAVAIVDMMMPNLNGVETVRALRETEPNLKCIVVSGMLDSAGSAQLAALKVDAFLLKPFPTDQLMTTLHSILPGNGQANHALVSDWSL